MATSHLTTLFRHLSRMLPASSRVRSVELVTPIRTPGWMPGQAWIVSPGGAIFQRIGG